MGGGEERVKDMGCEGGMTKLVKGGTDSSSRSGGCILIGITFELVEVEVGAAEGVEVVVDVFVSLLSVPFVATQQ